jgi:glycosidase
MTNHNPGPAHGSERSLEEIDFSALTGDRAYFPSPADWEDEVLYFLLADRFSDKREYAGFADLEGRAVDGPGAGRITPLFDIQRDANTANREQWFESGKNWCGGTIAGLQDKLGYLKRLGITAIWLSPVFKQVARDGGSYHGYGIQNFLDVDPHFGSREELKAFVQAAHEAGIRVILDIILNHAGNVFTYQGNQRYFYYEGRQWPVDGYRRDIDDRGSLPFEPVDLNRFPDAWPDGAIWPVEFQDPTTWTRRGEIRGWDAFPEYLDGDFFSLKDIDHGQGFKDPGLAWDLLKRIDEFERSRALVHLGKIYSFWIAYADIDGYRIDTVKHMEPGAVRYFANVIHEFAQSIGKENFILIGEIAGDRTNAVRIVETTGIDAALGIADIPDKLEFLAKGWRSPGNPQENNQDGYFNLFRNSAVDYKNSHQWFGKHIVTLFEDHDQVGVERKFRFCGQGENSYRSLIPALALNLTTAGIPCIYYGTEQAFNGADWRTGSDTSFSDVFLRECMFGGPFGSFQSAGRHFFNESSEIYRFVQEASRLRKNHIALRRGRQYLRQVSASGAVGDFYYPQPINGEMRWVVAWSRLFADQECLCAVNTDTHQSITVWATVDHHASPPGKVMRCLYSTDPGQRGGAVTAEPRNGSAIRITVPAGGFVVYG